ncbi:hypothetical protein ABPG77_008044 [Micractinium sp. CCAP 211/92]
MLAGVWPCSSSGCAALQRPRRPARASGRSMARVTAWWSPLGKGSLDETDDEILTAAAMSKHAKAAQARQRGEARHGVAQPGGGEDVPPTRQSLLPFATSLTFITAGAFFVGTMTRKYILQPPDGRPPYTSGGSSSSSKGKSSKRSSGKQQAARGRGAAPSVQELVAQHGGGSLLASETQGTPASPPSTQSAEATEERQAERKAAGQAAGAGMQQQAALAMEQQRRALERQADAAPQDCSVQQAAQPGHQVTDSWCEATLGPAVAAADAAAAGAAALAAAAPILDCGRVWILSRPTQDGGSVALRLLFPVGPSGEEQNCVALLAAEADAEAAQRLLARLLGLQTAPQRVSAKRIAAEAGRRRWAAAFYPAGSLVGALAAVEDAAAQQEEMEEEAAAGRGEQPVAGGLQKDPVELLQAVLQQQALLLSGEQMQAVAGALEASPAGTSGGNSSKAGSSGGSGGGGSSRETAATGSSASPPQQTTTQQAGGSAAQPAVQPSQALPPSASPALAPAAAAAAERQGRAAWDPANERLPRRHEDPGWWLSLPVLHVPQLVYADGAKGLMSVPLSLPLLASGGEALDGGAAAAEGRLERRLVAFESLKDAEGLLECPLEASGSWGVVGGRSVCVWGGGGGGSQAGPEPLLDFADENSIKGLRPDGVVTAGCAGGALQALIQARSGAADASAARCSAARCSAP